MQPKQGAGSRSVMSIRTGSSTGNFKLPVRIQGRPSIAGCGESRPDAFWSRRVGVSGSNIRTRATASAEPCRRPRTPSCFVGLRSRHVIVCDTGPLVAAALSTDDRPPLLRGAVHRMPPGPVVAEVVRRYRDLRSAPPTHASSPSRSDCGSPRSPTWIAGTSPSYALLTSVH
jgi:hypothetical protein